MLQRLNLSHAVKYTNFDQCYRLSSRSFSAAAGEDRLDDEKSPTTRVGHDLDPQDKHNYGTNLVKAKEPHQRYYVMLGVPNSQTNIPVEAVAPTPRTFVEYNGRKYPYPYRGLWEEEKGPEVMKWILESNFVNPDNGLIRVHKIPKKYRTKVLQYWYQAETDKPSYYRTGTDSVLLRLLFYALLYVAIGSVYMTYNFITPKNKNVFLYENWKRWNYEHH